MRERERVCVRVCVSLEKIKQQHQQQYGGIWQQKHKGSLRYLIPRP